MITPSKYSIYEEVPPSNKLLGAFWAFCLSDIKHCVTLIAFNYNIILLSFIQYPVSKNCSRSYQHQTKKEGVCCKTQQVFGKFASLGNDTT